MNEFVSKLEALREYICLKIDWDTSWPLMSFETYLEYKKDDPNVLHWLRVFLVQAAIKPAPAKPKEYHNDMAGLMNQRNINRQLGNIPIDDVLRHYRSQGLANQQMANQRTMGLGYGLSGLFGNIVGNPFPFPNPFTEH